MIIDGEFFARCIASQPRALGADVKFFVVWDQKYFLLKGENKMSKKFLCLLLALIMVVSVFAACGKTDKPDDGKRTMAKSALLLTPMRARSTVRSPKTSITRFSASSTPTTRLQRQQQLFPRDSLSWLSLRQSSSPQV